MPSVDEATKIVHSTQPTSHRGYDPLLVHNPSGGTGYQEGPSRQNPTGATAAFSHGVVDTNPLGDRAEISRGVVNPPLGGRAPISPGVNANPEGTKAPFSKGVVEPPR